MKKAIMTRLDAWAAKKTQKEFNNFIVKWFVIPFFIIVFLIGSTIDSWPL